MNNEVEDIVGLFDEFYIIDGEEQEPVRTAKAAVTEPVVSPIENAPAAHVSPAEPELPVSVAPEPVEQPALKEQPLPAINYSGANKRHIAIIYNDKNNDSRENVELLSNLITKALKFSMDDVAVVRLSRNETISLHQIFDVLGTKQAIIWGVPEEAKQLGFAAPVHDLLSIGRTRVMIADFVNEYHGKAEYKTRLWEAVQHLFSK